MSVAQHHNTTNVPPIAALNQMTDVKEIHTMLARIARRRDELDAEIAGCSTRIAGLDNKLKLVEKQAYVLLLLI